MEAQNSSQISQNGTYSPAKGLRTLHQACTLEADDTDYDQRNTANLVALTVLLVLTIALVWIVMAFDERRRIERCIGSGRKDCLQIEAPARGPVHVSHPQ